MYLSLVARLSPTLHAEALTALPDWTRLPNQSVTYARMFAEVAGQHGLSRDRILACAGLPAELLDDPAGRISLQAIWQILDAILTLKGSPGLTFEAGLQMPLTAHGSLGYALLCAATPREAIAILQRFWGLRGRGFGLQVTLSEQQLFFEVSCEAPLPAPLRQMQLSAILTSMYQGMTFIMPQLPARATLWLDGPAPPDFDHYQSRLPPVSFEQPRNGLLLHGDLAALDQPLPTANPEAKAQAIAQCERELALLDDDNDIVRRVRAALTPGAHGYPTPEQLAAQLHLTTRTFRRRLQEQGYRYAQLLEEARRRDSLTLLDNPALEIRRVATLLGYAEPANFTRAFRHWTGMTPSRWRQRSR